MQLVPKNDPQVQPKNALGLLCNPSMIFDKQIWKCSLRHVKPQNRDKTGKNYFNIKLWMDDMPQSFSFMLWGKNMDTEKY